MLIKESHADVQTSANGAQSTMSELIFVLEPQSGQLISKTQESSSFTQQYQAIQMREVS